MHPSRLRLGPSQSRPLTDASPGSARSPGLRVGARSEAVERPYTCWVSNRKPVLSLLSGHEVSDIAQPAVGPRRCPPKAEATGSNAVGRANPINRLSRRMRADLHVKVTHR